MFDLLDASGLKYASMKIFRKDNGLFRTVHRAVINSDPSCFGSLAVKRAKGGQGFHELAVKRKEKSS